MRPLPEDSPDFENEQVTEPEVTQSVSGVAT